MDYEVGYDPLKIRYIVIFMVDEIDTMSAHLYLYHVYYGQYSSIEHGLQEFH